MVEVVAGVELFLRRQVEVEVEVVLEEPEVPELLLLEPEVYRLLMVQQLL